jgi:hypothetical protein
MSDITRSVSARPVTELPADSIGLFGTTSSTGPVSRRCGTCGE